MLFSRFLFSVRGERDVSWKNGKRKKGVEQLKEYRKEKNSKSIDGIEVLSIIHQSVRKLKGSMILFAPC